MQKIGIDKYLDAKGKIIAWPNTKEGQQLVCEYLANLFEMNRIYTEKEITQVISDFHLFMNPTMLRRELISRKLLFRNPDGSSYWK